MQREEKVSKTIIAGAFSRGESNLGSREPNLGSRELVVVASAPSPTLPRAAAGPGCRPTPCHRHCSQGPPATAAQRSPNNRSDFMTFLSVLLHEQPTVVLLWGRHLASWSLALDIHNGHEDLRGSSRRSVIPYVHGRTELYYSSLYEPEPFFF
jgi:hypothetical protein